MPPVSRLLFIESGNQKNTREYRFEPPVNVYAIMLETGLHVGASCGGNNNCGKCLVLVKGNANAVSETERQLLSQNYPGVIPGEYAARLACFCIAEADCEVVYSVSEGMRISGTPHSRGLGSNKDARFGAAVDIGTTTIEYALFDLKDRERVYYSREMNEQRIFGADVLTRIESSNRNGYNALHEPVVGQIARMVKEGEAVSSVSCSLIEDMTVTGNTTMLHFFCGLDPAGIGVSPFLPKSLFGFAIKAIEVFPFLPETTNLYIAPCIGPYIGGDISCGILSCGLADAKGAAILVDVGTNGEIALVKNSEIICCSTAAGPAFEGGEISMGMIAAKGAVNRVWYDGADILYSTIDSAPPEGICGTGIISAVQALLTAGIIDDSGRIQDDGRRYANKLLQADSMPAVYVADTAVYLTQRDIRNIQLAKAAIAAGIDTLLHQTDTAVRDVEKLFLSGGFGSGIDVTAASAIGIFPKELARVAESLGNSALAGAAQLLFEEPCRREIERIAKESKEISLSSNPFFMDRYVERMLF